MYDIYICIPQGLGGTNENPRKKNDENIQSNFKPQVFCLNPFSNTVFDRCWDEPSSTQFHRCLIDLSAWQLDKWKGLPVS